MGCAILTWKTDDPKMATPMRVRYQPEPNNNFQQMKHTWDDFVLDR